MFRIIKRAPWIILGGAAVWFFDPDGNVVEFWSQDMGEYTSAARAGGKPGTLPGP